ncbi:neuropeptide FF receptor 2-like [Exaiptasia diaphana]|uniref:G-protein coupled receptors family 1 profile domain-containing protein n=1 Tax=Exaiptasia diaphana TaxID=2652724 RepID=A0A913WP41_EXADI|nr:neuropeptide FF receptor 2-like [Exaiptasia diaphana]
MNNTSSCDGAPSEMAATKITLYSLVLAWSLFGNILVLLVILKNKALRTNFNILIINMAISDLVIPCLALPMKIADTTLRPMEWVVDGPFGNFLCKACYFIADISPVVSSFSLVIIAVNRFFAIAVPVQGFLSRKRTLALIVGIWFLATVLLSPYFYIYRLETTGWTKCISTWSPAFDDTKAETIFTIILITVVFVFPCITIGVLYSVMLCKLQENSNRAASMLNDDQFRRRQRKDKTIFIMTIVIMFLYLVLWGPFFCTLVVLSFFIKENTASVQTVIITVQFLGYINSAVHPCIYFCFLKKLRQGLRRLLRRMFMFQFKEPSIAVSNSRTSAMIRMTNYTTKKCSKTSYK